MHHLLVVLEWVFGLSALTITALVLIAFCMMTVRAMIGIKAKPWSGEADVEAAMKRASAEGYPHRFLVALDIFMNVTFFLGEQDETMSTHAWRASNAGKLWGKAMNAWLCWFQPNHGFLAASGDLWRASARVKILTTALGLNGQA
jgi:hypothetical protein